MLEIYERLSKGSTNRRRLDVADFLSLKVSLPLLAEQRRVSERLKECEQLMADTQDLLGVLGADSAQMLDSVMHLAFPPIE